MPIPGSGDDGNTIADFAQFELAREISDAERKKPWPSGIHSRTLYKKKDFRVVLIAMEAASRIKEHHVDGTSSVQVLRGRIRFTALGRTHELENGGFITLGASIPHDVESLAESAFLLTISWPLDRQLAAMPHRGYGT